MLCGLLYRRGQGAEADRTAGECLLAQVPREGHTGRSARHFWLCKMGLLTRRLVLSEVFWVGQNGDGTEYGCCGTPPDVPADEGGTGAAAHAVISVHYISNNGGRGKLGLNQIEWLPTTEGRLHMTRIQNNVDQA